MKVKETVERECCDPRKDIVAVPGHPKGQWLGFCKHCGRHWEEESEWDGVESASNMKRIPFPWEPFRNEAAEHERP
jgi:hypothetical protein